MDNMYIDNTMSVAETVSSKVIDEGAKIAFEGGNHTMEIASHAVEYAVEHVADTVVDHAAAVALGQVAEQYFSHYVSAPVAPARIAGTAVKEIFFSDKSADEIGQTVKNSSFKAIVIGGIVTAVASHGLAVIPYAIPAAIYVAKSVTPIYGGIAWSVAKIIRVFK
ncbi:MAG: hypothetical protein PHY16_10945 [Methylobacter sp.]|nr:hypothetical protein [Methylobacter sp.]